MFLEDPPFPQCPSFGYQAQPMYSNTISSSVSGREKRNRNWLRPLTVLNCTCGPREETDVEELVNFWHAMGGSECGFRFKDWHDYRSARFGQDITPFDQSFEPLIGSPSGLQLIKTYQFGSRTQVRPILKPVPGTIRIAEEGVEKTEGSEWTLDATNGIVSLNFTPSGVMSWGGEFDLPMRFDSEFPVEIMNYRIQSVTFQLRELRDPDDDL